MPEPAPVTMATRFDGLADFDFAVGAGLATVVSSRFPGLSF
jgi:hypothetical protein